MPSEHSEPSEPWLRGTLTEVPAVLRAVLHAIELATEDIVRFCGPLTSVELHARAFGLAPVAFHIRHIARSTDRLLTYAEGHLLSDEQTAAIRTELKSTSTKEELFSELDRAMADAKSRIQAFDVAALESAREVGRRRLPTTIAGLLVHIADHTQRHVGQAITTSKIVLAQREGS